MKTRLQAIDMVNHTDESVVLHMWSSWTFTAQVGEEIVQEDSGGSVVNISSMIMDVTAVTKAMAKPELDFYPCMLSL
uniref:Uncharacterized protein n=1 Tax=Arion vulgaris TaxID=1028688 RepID=A0A0B7AMT2_9EUPU